MQKIIVIDVANDTNGQFMRQAINQGAFPKRVGMRLGNILGSITQRSQCKPVRFQWEDQSSFPVSNPIDAIMNYLYATMQRPLIPSNIMQKMFGEAKDIMEVMEDSDDFDPEIKSEILKGSKHVFNRVLEDGTEVRIEITSPATRKKKEEAEAEAELPNLVKTLEKTAMRKAASVARQLTVDIDKMVKVAREASIVDPEYKEVAKGLAKMAEAGVAISYKDNSALVDSFIKRASEDLDLDPKELLMDISADDKTEDKVLIHGTLVDKTKLQDYPFDSKSNAVKAVGKQVVDIVCDGKGAVSLDKLQDLEEAAHDNPVIDRLMDQLMPLLEMEASAQ